MSEQPDAGAGGTAGTAGTDGAVSATAATGAERQQEHRRRLPLRLPRIADDDDGLAQRLAQ